MLIIKQVSFYTLLNELQNSDACRDWFSRLAIIALYDYLEELEEAEGEDIEINIYELFDKYKEITKEEYKTIYRNEEINEDNEYIIKILENNNILYINH